MIICPIYITLPTFYISYFCFYIFVKVVFKKTFSDLLLITKMVFATKSNNFDKKYKGYLIFFNY